jgi:hypothetical protein
MRRDHVIFNGVGLFIAGLLSLAALSTYLAVLPGVPTGKRDFWHFLIAIEIMMGIFIGGGGIANLAKRQITGWPTGIMIFAYCMSIWLFPMGIWGIVILLAERKRRKRESGRLPPT